MTLDEALQLAARENGLAPEYVDIVRPLIRNSKDLWPRCCGGGCEPCSLTLIRVAERTLELIKV